MANVSHKNLTGVDLHEPKGAATASDGEVYIADGAASGGWAPKGPQVALYSQRITDGVAASAGTPNAWTTSIINTEEFDPDNIGTLASNQITLQAGTYYFHAIQSVAGNRKPRTRIQNITDGTTVNLSISGTTSADSTRNENHLVTVAGGTTIAGAKAFELQYYVDIASGLSLGADDTLTVGDEIYVTFEVWKLK
jgi:hypothetical protein